MRLLPVLIAICLISCLHGGRTEYFTSGSQKWYTDNQCRYQMIDVLQQMIKTTGMDKGDNANWAVYLPCGYNNSQQELNKLRPTSADQKIFIIKGCDNLSRKDTLWTQLQHKYGVVEATKLVPRSYVLNSPSDLQALKREFNPKKVYIMKKNIQRQEGLKMTQNYNDIMSGLQSGYVVVQEMLQDPFLIEKRKTNCRIYLLVVCQNAVKRGYIYTDGFMYYTPKAFKPYSMDRDEVITTGYIDRSVYERNPLTLQDFSRYLDKQGYAGSTLFTKVGKLLAKTLDASSPNFCTPSNVSKQTTFQLFGCDVAFNNKFEVQLIEINKGPDLGGKDERDRTLKQTMVNELFRLIGVGGQPINIDVNKISHGFMRVW